MGWPFTTKIIRFKQIGKQIIEDLEDYLTGEQKETSNTENLALDEVTDSDESITAEAKAINEMVNDLK